MQPSSWCFPCACQLLQGVAIDPLIGICLHMSDCCIQLNSLHDDKGTIGGQHTTRIGNQHACWQAAHVRSVCMTYSTRNQYCMGWPLGGVVVCPHKHSYMPHPAPHPQLLVGVHTAPQASCVVQYQ